MKIVNIFFKKMDFSDVSLTLRIIEIIDRFSTLKQNLKDEFIVFLNYELRGIDDEFSIIIDNVIFLLEMYPKSLNRNQVEVRLNNLINKDISRENLDLVLKCFIDYFDDYYT